MGRFHVMARGRIVTDNGLETAELAEACAHHWREAGYDDAVVVLLVSSVPDFQGQEIACWDAI
jgi:hypothetical protein